MLSPNIGLTNGNGDWSAAAAVNKATKAKKQRQKRLVCIVWMMGG
jgi:hypothetical protein